MAKITYEELFDQLSEESDEVAPKRRAWNPIKGRKEEENYSENQTEHPLPSPQNINTPTEAESLLMERQKTLDTLKHQLKFFIKDLSTVDQKVRNDLISKYTTWIQECMKDQFIQFDTEHDATVIPTENIPGVNGILVHNVSKIGIFIPEQLENSSEHTLLFNKLGQHMETWNHLRSIEKNNFSIPENLTSITGFKIEPLHE